MPCCRPVHMYLQSILLFWKCLQIRFPQGSVFTRCVFYLCTFVLCLLWFLQLSFDAGVSCVCKVRRFGPVSGPLHSAASQVLFSCHPHKLTCHTDGSPYPQSLGRARNGPLARTRTANAVVPTEGTCRLLRSDCQRKLASDSECRVCCYVSWYFTAKSVFYSCFSYYRSNFYQNTKNRLKTGTRSSFYPFAQRFAVFPEGHCLVL